MLNVSSQFHSSISAFPRTMSALVEFDMVDVQAQNNCTPTATSIAGIGGVSQATDGLSQTRKYMSEENDYLLLDGSFFTPPKPTDTDTMGSIGWWSAVISDSSGNFATPPVLTLAQSSPFTSLGLTFIFSPMTGDYCNSIQIVTTDTNSVQTTYNLIPTTANYFFSQQLTNIVQVTVTFNSTNKPLRRVHLSEVLFGEQFLWTGQNLFDLDVLEELDPLGNSAPPKECHASIANNLNNFNLYLGNLQKKQPLKPSLNLIYADGTMETVPMGTFYLYNWLNDNNYLSSTLYARDLLDIADGTTYYAFGYTGSPITLYNLAVAVIADFQSQAGMKVAYQIDSALQGISTSGVLSAMSHHDALMYIAQAGMAVLYVDRYNILHIRQSVSQQPLNTMPYIEELPLAMQETYPKIAIQDPYNYFTLNVYSNSVASSTSNIYTGNVTVNSIIETWVTYTTPATPASCMATVTGGTLVTADYYANAAFLVILGAGTVGISIDGLSITGTSIQQIVNTSGTQPSNEVDLDNPLVTDATMATNILNWYANECGNVYLYEVESWMDPSLENGDVLFWDSQYSTAEKQAKAIRQEFRFNGTLSGTINGKGWGDSISPSGNTVYGSGTISVVSSLTNTSGNIVYGSGSISAVSSLTNGISNTVQGSGSISSTSSVTSSGSNVTGGNTVQGSGSISSVSSVTSSGSSVSGSTTVYGSGSISSVSTLSSSGSSVGVATVYGAGSISSVGSVTSSGSSVTTAPISVTGVTISPSSLPLTVGNSGWVTPTVYPWNASNQNVWYASSNAGVATVSSSGYVTAVGNGTAYITAYTYDGGYSASTTVTVTSATIPVTGVSLNTSGVGFSAAGQNNQLTATIYPSNATNQNVSWSSNNTSVVTVSSSGYLTAGPTAGTAVVTATTYDGGYTATCNVTLTLAFVAVTGITITYSTPSIARGSNYGVIDYTIQPSNATNQGVYFQTTNSSVAVASYGSPGAAYITSGSTPGTAILYVISNDTTNGPTIHGACIVTIT